MCQCRKYAFYVCRSCVYQCFLSGHRYLCASPYVEWGKKIKKTNIAPILLTHQQPPPPNHRPLPASFTPTQQKPVRTLLTVNNKKKNKKQNQKLCTVMVTSVFDLCTVLHQQTFEIPLVVLSKHQRKKKPQLRLVCSRF